MYSNILNIEKRKYEYELWAEYESDLILIWDGFLIFSDSQTTVSLLSATVTCQWCQCQCTFSQTVKHSWFWILDQLLQIAVQVQVVSNCKLHILTQPAPSWRYEIQWWSEWSCIAESWANAWPSCRSSHLLEAIQGGMQGRPGSYFDFVFRPSVQPRESHGRLDSRFLHLQHQVASQFQLQLVTCWLTDITHWHELWLVQHCEMVIIRSRNQQRHGFQSFPEVVQRKDGGQASSLASALIIIIILVSNSVTIIHRYGRVKVICQSAESQSQ